MRPASHLALVLVILLLILLSATEGALAQAINPQSWTGPDNEYHLNWNFSPQTAITASNVASLEVKWSYPVPDAPSLLSSAQGAMVTPLVVNGIVYTVANWGAVLALNAADGVNIWFTNLPLAQNYSSYLQPSVPPSLGIPLGHFHQILYSTHILDQPLVWVIANTYQVFALNAFTGEVVLNFNPLLQGMKSIRGNFGVYDQDTPSILLDEKRGLLLFGPSDSEGESSGRGYLQGWNVNSTSPNLLWTTYIIPPQDGTDPSWSLDSVANMTHAYIFNGTAAVDLKALPPDALMGILGSDWGNFGYDGVRSYAGASTAWGGPWAIDDQSGVAYVGTDTATPDWNGTDRPGPDLWSDSVLAVNLTDGRLIWGFQAMPHSLGDLDCSWNVVLANETIGGETQPVVYKGCKDGYVFALNGLTGSMIWYLKPQSVKFDNVFVANPLNRTEMADLNWYGYPSTRPILQNPSDTGSLESDIAYDPVSNSLYLVTYNEPKLFNIEDVGSSSVGGFDYATWEFDWGTVIQTIVNDGPINSTVMAVSAATGGVKWTYSILNEPYRGGLTVSAGVVYVSLLNGTLLMLNQNSGRYISSKNIGGELLIQPSIAQDVSGNTAIFLTDTGSSRWGPVFSGFVDALTLVKTPAGPSQSLPYLEGAAAGSLSVAGALLIYRLLSRKTH